MLRLSGLSVARGARVLLRDVTIAAAPGERIGLVGTNGSGKSSLFAAVLGELGAEAGSIEAPPPERIAHVAQDIEVGETSALDYVLSGHAPLAHARAELARAEAGADDLALAQAHARLAELDPGAVAARATAVMHGLGFGPADVVRSTRTFSGGWRNRLALCRALLRPADLLLLDEPTNHLDLDSVIWLETWLRRQDATVLIVSHDREFLDRCAGTIWHLADAGIRRYKGDYSAFESALVERQRQQEAQARGYRRTAEHLQAFVDRFRAQATKARQAQSRLKMLQRLVEVEPARAQREWRFEFPQPERLPQRLVDGAALELGYGAVRVLGGVRVSIDAGDRIGVLGVNGAGKSTLVKAVTGALAPLGGELRRAPGAAIGYFAQHQLDQMAADESPLEQLRRLAPQAREQELRDFLGRFRFSGELATLPVGRMSGGEKARCALALIAWRRPNLLVLDEPTNHLDMETREALAMALSTYEGALLLVSHDRHLLRATTDTLWLVHDGMRTDFDGDLEAYADFVLSKGRESAGGTAPLETGPSRREQRRAQAEARERRARARGPLERRLRDIERELEDASAELRAIDLRLAQPDFYHGGDAGEVAALLKLRAALEERVGRLEDQWLQGQGELDTAG